MAVLTLTEILNTQSVTQITSEHITNMRDLQRVT